MVDSTTNGTQPSTEQGNSPDELLDAEVFKELTERKSRRTTDAIEFSWTEPRPLVSSASLPSFPLDGLPAVLRDMVIEVAGSTQIHVDLPAIISMSALCASFVGRATVHAEGARYEPVTIYSLGLARSGTRKSSTVSTLVRPLRAAQKQIADEVIELRRTLSRQKEVEKARVARARSEAMREDTDWAWRAYHEQLEVFENIVVPEIPVLMTDDATPEALALYMEQNGGRISVFDAEGGGLLTIAGARYSTESNIDLLLKAHIGDATGQLRVGRTAVNMERPIASIGVLTQADTLQKLLGVDGAKSRGLIARLLIASPPDTLGYREIYTNPVSTETMMAYSTLLQSFVMSLWSETEPKEIQLDPEAYARLKKFDAECEVRLRDGHDLAAALGFGGKFAGAALRYAAIHHLGHYGAVNGFVYAMNVHSLEWGISVAEWSLEHYFFATGNAGMDDDIRVGRRILKWLQKQDPQLKEISISQIYRVLGNLSVDAIESAVALLEEHGWLAPQANENRGVKRGRKPSPQWLIHPALYSPDGPAVD